MTSPTDLRVAQLKLELNPKFTKHDAAFVLTCILMVASTAYAASLWVMP